MRITIKIVLVAIFVLSVSRPALAQDKLNFAYISPNAGSSSVLWIAKDAGIFKKHGLDVNVIYIEGTPKALMSLFAGELHVVAGTGPAVASAKVRGADASMIMGFEVFLPYYLVAQPNIKSAEELKGKIGANHTAATSADFAIRLGLKSIGLDPDKDVNLRVVGATNLRLIMMQQKQADFTIISIDGARRSGEDGTQSRRRSRQQENTLPAQRLDQQPEAAQRTTRCHAALRPRRCRVDSFFQEQQSADHWRS